MTKQELLRNFKRMFGGGGEPDLYFAPGRVNLIGEHTDYNGGHVFPCALTIGTYGAARPRADRRLRFASLNFSKTRIWEGSLDNLQHRPEDGWANYAKGVLWALAQKGHVLPCGFDLLIYGNLPSGSGLSSSASLEVLVGVVARDCGSLPGLSMQDLALIGQYAENQYNGVNCGIMDQFAVAMGKKDHAIYLDTATLEYQYAPLELGDTRLVIANTCKRRGLSDSAYNERRAECEAALGELQKIVHIRSLGDLDEEGFAACQGQLTNPVWLRRARHAVLENQRTKRAVAALRQGDLEGFGRLMNESHLSLRDDYEVTGRELDTLVEAAWEQDGVLGSRMTGAGFGGCTVSLVRAEAVDTFVEQVGQAYRRAIGYDAAFYLAAAADGARRLTPEEAGGGEDLG